MLPLASTEPTSSSPSRSKTPRSLSFVMFLPLGAMPRRSATYCCMHPTVARSRWAPPTTGLGQELVGRVIASGSTQRS